MSGSGETLCNTLIVSVDVGTDTVKSAFAIADTNRKIICGKISVNDGEEPFPSLAYYLKDSGKWQFGNAVKSAAQNSFQYVVKIKELLWLLNKREKNPDESDYYFKKKLFKNFYFPPVDIGGEKSLRALTAEKRTFEADQTPQKVCEQYFEAYFRAVVAPCLKSLATTYKPDRVIFSVVYPLNVHDDYKKELQRLIAGQFDTVREFVGDLPLDIGNWGGLDGFSYIRTLSAPKAIGLYAFHTGVLASSKHVLVVNLGETEVSLAKINIQTNGKAAYIAVDGSDSHSMPIAIGGRNCDDAINGILEDKISERPVLGVGSKESRGHEKATYYEQFKLMDSIKRNKRMYCLPEEQYDRCFGKGVIFDVARGVQFNLRVSKQEFLYGNPEKNVQGCVAKLYAKVWDYIEKELGTAASKDVDTLVLSGGTAESYGLDNYFSARIGEFNARNNRRISVANFDNAVPVSAGPFSVSRREDMVYSAALGTAIYYTKRYFCETKASYSYGTWAYPQGTDPVKTYHEMLAMGTIISESGGSFWGAPTSLESAVGKTEHVVSDDEFFAAVAPEGACFKVGDNVTHREIRANAIREYKLVTIAKGNLTFRCPTGFISGYSFKEGIRIDTDGHATPVFESVKYGENVTITPDKKFVKDGLEISNRIS